MPQVVVRDQVLGKDDGGGMTLTFPVERITVRELIRGRVYQEVDDHNRSATGAVYRAWGAVPGAGSAVAASGRKPEVDWRIEFDRACEAFVANRFFVLVGDHQAASLDEQIDLSRDTEVTFVRLVLLAGG